MCRIRPRAGIESAQRLEACPHQDRAGVEPLAFSALQLSQFPIEPCARITDLLFDVFDGIRLEIQAVDEPLGDMTRMIG